MNVRSIGRTLTVVLLTALAGSLAGCASNATPARELPRCAGHEALVCYGKEATRLERRTRLEDVEFCRCESVVF